MKGIKLQKRDKNKTFMGIFMTSPIRKDHDL